MIEITLKSNTGFSKTIPAPSNLSELPLPRYIDFQVEQRKIGEEGINNVLQMARCVKEFYGLPLEEILSHTSGNLYGEDVKGLEGSLRGLYAYAAKMVADGIGRAPVETDRFEYKGETYKMPVILQQALQGELILPTVEVIEAIEAAEVQRWTEQQVQVKGDPDGALKRKILGIAQEHIEKNGDPEGKVIKNANRVADDEIEKVGDPDGTLRATEFLKLCAILYKKEGEHLPIDDGERDRWVNDRALHFWDLDAQTCLNVAFFLRALCPRSESINAMSTFFGAASLKALEEILPLKGLLTTVRKIITRKSFSGLAGVV
jgi:hypothetical protein